MAAPSASHRAQRHRPRRSFGSVLAGAVMNLLAAGGVLCVILVITAVVSNISLIMFKTGSMSPTIPAGSLAVVQTISAEEIAVGDIVTVDRPGQLPVTHRVIAVHPQLPGEALIEMQGDANPTPDPGLYRVREVRQVLWSIPGAAYVVVWLSNPYVLGSITLAAAALVLWAFWPRRDESTPHTDTDLPETRS
ncbi:MULTISPECIES: signal peptidase I [Rhodococcus]|uniref:signal peptidase I n=2 Tax=Nocardiaceae TaxID=85025 RepID=UPI000688A260|nr:MULTISPECIES: signal peptidase I [Rhodococcus]AOD24262.1 signal peptidase I [Rhodococcus sp. p52]MCW3472267.1 signal peptidase I [Rhodococcus pyridinivorans]UPW03056.1 signal peptidase I [Rhodococcus pyridinivorans]